MLRRLLVLGVVLLALPAAAGAATQTVDFETPAAGTTLTDQYKDVGGPGQGVVFEKIPGDGPLGHQPVIKAPPAGQAQSGMQVGEAGYCPGCECCFSYRSTGTFTVPHKTVSVRIGVLGDPSATCTPATENDPTCSKWRIRGYDAAGQQIAESEPALITTGAGVHTLLSVSTPTAAIYGFEILARPLNEPHGDYAIPALDDLTWDIPEAPAPPDFSLMATETNPTLRQGSTLTDTLTIGRLSGSTGDIALALTGTLPQGVHATISPNPASGGSATITFTADPDAVATGATPADLTLTATPSGPGAGSAPRTMTLHLQVKTALDLRLQGPADLDLAACNVSTALLLARDFGLAGPVGLSVTGMTNGVTASLSPPQATFPNGAAGEIITLNVLGPATGFAVQNQTLTVHASAPPLAERTAQVTVHGTCPAQYDTQITSMMITQGTQTTFRPTRNASNTHGIYRYTDDIPGAALLRRHGPTIVRVWADNASGPAEGVSQVPVVLNGWTTNGVGSIVPLPGTPLLPIGTPRVLKNGGPEPTDAEIAGEDTAYAFRLPPTWTQGKNGIGAEVLASGGVSPLPLITASTRANFAPISVFTPRKVTPCVTEVCTSNDSMAISRIPFLEAPTISVQPAQMTTGATFPSATDVFFWLRQVVPQELEVKPYAGMIDISDLEAAFTACKARVAPGDRAAYIACSNTANEDTTDRFEDWVCDNPPPSNGWDVGINTGVARGLTSSNNLCFWEGALYDDAVMEFKRPLTSVGHEFYHLLGRPHASYANGGGADGQTAESWPPDELGYLQSNGLATTQNAGTLHGGPFAVVTETAAKPIFDFMSYAADSSELAQPKRDALTLNTWISVHNWNAVLESRRYHRAAVRATAPRVRAWRATGPRTPSLHVSGVVNTEGASITSVVARDAPAPPTADSAYHLLGLDAAGKTIADVVMFAAAAHVDGGSPPLLLDGLLPATGVASVAIVKDGQTLATRARSAHAPTVSLRGTPRFARGKATIRWTAKDADADKLTVTVDYSTDNATTFHRIYSGPDKGQARLAARLLSRASRAKVRVTANDGFQNTTKLSRSFRSPGAPPEVTILAPSSGDKQPADAPLVLSGQAFDDRSVALTGKRLTWRLGRTVIARGAQTSATGLPAGRQTLTLEARDSAGRIGRRAITVTIGAARPVFLKLEVPAKAKRTARTLKLKAGASIGARLTVTVPGAKTQRYEVRRATRTVTLRIPKGTRPLTLTFTLKSGSLSSASRAVVRRT